MPSWLWGLPVSRALRFSLLLAFLLLLSATPKFVAGNSVLRPDHAGLRVALANRLRAQGFAQLPARSAREAFIRAQRGKCRLVAMNIEPEGHLVTWFIANSAKFGPARFHYAGRDSQSFPRLWPPVASFFQQAAFRAGLNLPREPVIAVAADPACANARVDWSGLQMWGKRVREAPAL